MFIDVSEELTAYVVYPEEGGGPFLHIVGKHVLEYTASHTTIGRPRPYMGCRAK
jgi:hypothetical protein